MLMRVTSGRMVIVKLEEKGEMGDIVGKKKRIVKKRAKSLLNFFLSLVLVTIIKSIERLVLESC